MIKLHATYSKIISKFTSNISKNTSKFTSKTNQIRLGGPRGGALPPTRAFSWLYPRPPDKGGALGPGNTLGRGSYAWSGRAYDYDEDHDEDYC